MTNTPKRFINSKKLRDFMRSRSWSEREFANQLQVSYHYIYRILYEERDGGRKLFSRLLQFCRREGLNIYDFVNLGVEDDTIAD